MDQLKKNLFWIILAVVVLGAVGLWFSYMPEMDPATATAKASDIKKSIDSQKKPDGIKTAAHVKAAEEMGKKLDEEKKALVTGIQKWPDFSVPSINKRFADAPAATRNIDFDNWMEAKRKALAKSMTDAGITPMADFDARLFFGTNIDKDISSKPLDLNAKNVAKHRDYQLRILALVEEIVDALKEKSSSIAITKFETDKERKEPIDTTKVGALALVNFTFHGPDETASINTKSYDAALAKVKYVRPTSNNPADSAGFQGVQLPVSVTSIDVEFAGHISTVTSVLRALEKNPKYMAVLTKADFERTSPLFPAAATNDPNALKDYAKAAFNPMINTHYGEGPVKVFATLEFSEFDKVKAAKMDAPAPTTTKATTTVRATTTR